jgi:GNAT superfamily N-acetyltransferase
MNVNFSTNEAPIEFINLDFDNADDIELFRKLYFGLFLKEFTDKDEIVSFEILLNQAIANAQPPMLKYLCVIAVKGEKIIGGIIGDYYWRSNSGLIEYIVVDSEERGKRIASSLMTRLTDEMSERAKKYKHEMIDYCFLEVENPVRFDDPELRKNANDRLGFWEKVSAKTLEMQYIQPPLQEGKNPVDYLMLNVIIYSPNLKTTSVPKQTEITFLHDYFKDCMNVEDIENNQYYKKVISEIEDDEIDLTPILEKSNLKKPKINV